MSEAKRCHCCQEERASLGKNGYGQWVCGECFEDCPGCTQGEIRLKDSVRKLVDWLDENSTILEHRENLVLRILKIVEEVGEVGTAVIGATGQNPRKGFTHSWEHVSDELCDVVVAALVALASVSPDDWEDRLDLHLAGLLKRAGLP